MNSDQVTMTGFEAPEINELHFLKSIRREIDMAVAQKGGDPKLISIKSTRPTKGSSGGYTVVKLENFTAFRLKLRGKQQYILLPMVFSDLLEGDFHSAPLPSEGKYLRLPVDDRHPISSYKNFLIRVAGETVNRYPKEWDCCSLYQQCSDVKACVLEDKELALRCGYRKILNSGRIFYGKNRNID